MTDEILKRLAELKRAHWEAQQEIHKTIFHDKAGTEQLRETGGVLRRNTIADTILMEDRGIEPHWRYATPLTRPRINIPRNAHPAPCCADQAECRDSPEGVF